MSTKYKGFKAFIPNTTRFGNKTTRKGTVISHQPYKPGCPESVTIRLNNGKTENICVGYPCLEPKKTPKPWRDILRANAKVPGIKHIGVCVKCHSFPQTTTLFDRRTGEKLKYTTTSTESAAVTLGDGNKRPNESKPIHNDSDTIYQIGNIEIEMVATYY